MTILDQRVRGRRPVPPPEPAGRAGNGAPLPAAGTRAPRLRAFTRSQVGGLPRPFWLLWSGTLINRIGYLVEPFLAFYLTGVRGLPLATTGAVLAVSGAGSVVSQLVSGVLSDRLGRRAMLTLGMRPPRRDCSPWGPPSGGARRPPGRPVPVP